MTNEHPADVLTDLIGVLGDVLRVKPEKIDPEQTFQSMGLDSLLVVEFVAVVNTRYGLRVLATDLYDFPTPASFAREVARAARSAAAATVSAPVSHAVSHAVSAAVPVAAAAAVPAAVPASATGRERQVPAAAAATRIAEVLREQLAGILCCDPWDIDTTAAFNVLGVDSIVGAELIAVVNRTFGLQERSVLLYEHPNLAAMAAYIATRTGAAAQDLAPAPAALGSPVPQAPEPAFRPVAGPVSAAPALTTAAAHAVRPLPGGDLDVLLDAIRDDRLTVDEALVLLARRG
ncbi:phosphopantetheine-binding protein [Streptomyces sp. NBC_01443]|uniref:phosphopantetheine-binding protein n=1 Tax=Streptomyces sp. NBC_01443 TaxID=2903868 RepID=UPI002253802F|nr:phosphopantetheine-binding protein [Streptomyces sp. NBC_01443]MCX4633232.1 phosphopantetheine-binding protein [Streptomyces sp. NBC_01443]